MDPLDDTLRAAMKALDDRAPVRTTDFEDDFAAKVLARIDKDPMENVTTEGSGTGTEGVGAPPRPMVTDDSGLHDIKALAKTTRQRVSRRITSQHDIDESLLSSSQSGLRAVALPEPARLVSLPSIEELALAEPSVARAAHKVAAHPEGAPKKRPVVWIAGGVMAAAAAVVLFVVVSGGGGAKKNDVREAAGPMSAGAVAGSGSSAAASEQPVAALHEGKTLVSANTQADGTPPAIGTGSAAARTDVGFASGSGSGSGSAAGSGSAVESVTTVGNATPAPKVEIAKEQHHGGKVIETGKPGGGAGHEKSGGKTDTLKVDKVKGDKGKKPGDPKSLDDLIDEAAGGANGSGAKKPVDVKPTLDKKELTPQDIRNGMGGVAKRAQACYDKFGQAGTVGVKASVAPSGSITKVAITGSFAGTPTGECVAAAVQRASFPAWDGPPMTVNYSYLLTE